MRKYPRVREQHIAVFGESGSGKTVLVSSFFGMSVQDAALNEIRDFVADDAGQGNRLLKNYLQMKDDAKLPVATRFSATRYDFSVKLKQGDVGAAKRRPFDNLQIAWHDYPGEWFTETPSTKEEEYRRFDTFRSLLRSDIALFLVDGQKLREYQGQEERYLASLFTNFQQSLARLKDDLLAEDGRLVEFPRIWIIALSKADLLPELDVSDFRDLLVKNATEHIDDLRSTISELIEAPDALSIGEDYLLLSSAKFELLEHSEAPLAIDFGKRLGVNLVMPIASVLPLERRVQWSERMDIPRKVLESLADGAEVLAVALLASERAGLHKVLEKFPKARVAVKSAGPVVIAAARLGKQQLETINTEAGKQRNYLTMMLTQFKLDLEHGEADGVLIRSRR